MAKRSSNNNRSNNSWLALFSFVAVMLLGLALVLSFVFGQLNDSFKQVATYIERIAFGIAIIVPAVLSYREARKKTTVWFVLWVIAVVLVVVFYVLRFIF